MKSSFGTLHNLRRFAIIGRLCSLGQRAQGGINRVNEMLNDFCLGSQQQGSYNMPALARYFHAQDQQKHRSFWQPKLGTNAHNHSFISFFLNALKAYNKQDAQATGEILNKLGLTAADLSSFDDFTRGPAQAARREALNKITTALEHYLPPLSSQAQPRHH